MSRQPDAALGVLLLSGTHEKAHYALVVATAAAALGRTTTLFTTNAGCQLLVRDAPLQRDPRESALAEAGVATIAELMDAALALPVRFIACEAGLRAESIPRDALLPGAEVAGIATFLEAVGAGQLVSL